MPRWGYGLAALALITSRAAQAAPSPSCETIHITDRDGVAEQVGLKRLVEMLAATRVFQTPKDVAADLELELRFSPPEGRILAELRSWAEAKPVKLTSGVARALEDFKTNSRTIVPMAEADAEAFRQRIAAALGSYRSSHSSAIVLESEPEGLPVVITSPENLVVPSNRNRTAAVLGCLAEGVELQGHVTLPDGRQGSFQQRASQTPNRIVIGQQSATNRPSPAVVDTEAPPTTGHARAPRKTASGRLWVVGLAASSAVVVSLIWWLLGRRQK